MCCWCWSFSSDGVKTFLPNGLSTFFIKGEPFFWNKPKILPRNPSNCTILDKWIFGKFMLADETFAKALRILETCV